jgi:hypothetical protein
MTNASISTNTDLPQTTDERRPLPSTSVNESSSVETSKTTAVANQTPEESIRRSRDKPDMFAEPAQDLPFPTELQRARQSTPGAFPQGGTATRSTTLSTTTTDASQSTASVSPLYIAASGMPLLTATLVAEDEDDATGHSETTSGTHSTPRHNDDDDEEKQRGSVVLATAEPWEQHSVTEKTLRRTRRKRCTYALVVLLGIVGLVLGVTLGITNRTNSRTDSQTTVITANDGTTTGDANGDRDSLDGDTDDALSVSQTSHVVAWPVATSCLDEPSRPLVQVSCGATETVRIRTVQNANCTLTSDRTNEATCVPDQLANSARLAVAFWDCTGIVPGSVGPVQAVLSPSLPTDTANNVPNDACSTWTVDTFTSNAPTVPTYLILGDVCPVVASNTEAVPSQDSADHDASGSATDEEEDDDEDRRILTVPETFQADWHIVTQRDGSCLAPGTNVTVASSQLQVCAWLEPNDWEMPELRVRHDRLPCRHAVDRGPSTESFWYQADQLFQTDVIVNALEPYGTPQG